MLALSAAIVYRKGLAKGASGTMQFERCMLKDYGPTRGAHTWIQRERL